MPKLEVLDIIHIDQPLESGDVFAYASNRETGQMSIEPLQDVMVNNRSVNTEYFIARSLGRRVRGLYSAESNKAVKGEFDIVTPLGTDEEEKF